MSSWNRPDEENGSFEKQGKERTNLEDKAQKECRKCRENEDTGRKEKVSEENRTIPGQNLQAQESINFLILSADEPNFKWKLPPESLLASKFSLQLILPKEVGSPLYVSKAWLSCHLNALVSNASQLFCPHGVFGRSRLWGKDWRSGLIRPFDRVKGRTVLMNKDSFKERQTYKEDINSKKISF